MDYRYADALKAIQQSTMFSSDKKKAISALNSGADSDIYEAVIDVVNSSMWSSDKAESIKNICKNDFIERRRRGRPRKDDAMNRIVRFRLTSEDKDMLEYIQSRTCVTMSEILRKGIKYWFEYYKLYEEREE